MNAQSVLYRKVLYLGGIVLLLFPLFWLGRPEVRGPSGQLEGGGTLAQMRHDMGLSPAELGELDPASQTMKLATLGLRGVATWILWDRADEYRTKENWDKLAATLNTLRRLTPHYISVWEYQAWNVSYNVSKEFDYYEHRYLWVKRGIEYLMTGTRYNRHNPRLLWSLGWFTGHKIGRSDEHDQFRRLFKDDLDFQNKLNDHINVDLSRGAEGKPDNWLAARLWYLRAIDVDTIGIPLQWMRASQGDNLTKRGRSAVLFYYDPSKQLLNYSEAITEELTPGEITRSAWGRASTAVVEFGNREIPLYDGRTIRLNDLEGIYRRVLKLRSDLDQLTPGLRDQIRKEREDKLTPEQRVALSKQPIERTREEHMLIRELYDKLKDNKIFVSNEDLVARLPKTKTIRGRDLLRKINDQVLQGKMIDNQRAVINYEYWVKRAEIEQQKTTADARRLVLEGDRKKTEGDPEGAVTAYEKAWDNWAIIFDAYPELVYPEPDIMAEDLEESIQNYEAVLSQLDRDFPADFKLNRLREFYLRQDELRRMQILQDQE